MQTPNRVRFRVTKMHFVMHFEMHFEITPSLLEIVVEITPSFRGGKPPTVVLWNLQHNVKRKGRAEKAEAAKAAKADALR